MGDLAVDITGKKQNDEPDHRPEPHPLRGTGRSPRLRGVGPRLGTSVEKRPTYFFFVDFLAVAFLVAFLGAAFFVAFFAVAFFVAFLAGMFTSSRRSSTSRSSRRHALEAPALPLAHATPHPVPLVAAQGVVQALDANRAVGADPLGLSRRPSLFGEEDLRIVIATPRAVLPWDEMVHALSPELHRCDSGSYTAGSASPQPQLFSFSWRSGSSVLIVAC